MPGPTLSELESDCCALVSGLGYRRIAQVVERKDCSDFAFQNEGGWLVFIRCAETDHNADLSAIAEMSGDLMFLHLILLRPTGVAPDISHGRATIVSTRDNWRQELRTILSVQ